MVGPWTLNPQIQVRILAPQPNLFPDRLAVGRYPLKVSTVVRIHLWERYLWGIKIMASRLVSKTMQCLFESDIPCQIYGELPERPNGLDC